MLQKMSFQSELRRLPKICSTLHAVLTHKMLFIYDCESRCMYMHLYRLVHSVCNLYVYMYIAWVARKSSTTSQLHHTHKHTHTQNNHPIWIRIVSSCSVQSSVSLNSSKGLQKLEDAKREKHRFSQDLWPTISQVDGSLGGIKSAGAVDLLIFGPFAVYARSKSSETG